MSRTETLYTMGFRLTYPDAFDHTLGQISPMEIGDSGDGVLLMMYSYIAVSTEELKAFNRDPESGELREEDALKLADAMGCLLVVVGVDGGLGPEAVAKKLKIGGEPKDSITEVGRSSDLVYFAITDRSSEESFMKEIEPAFAKEFSTLQPALIEALKKAEYMGPQIPGANLVGKTLHFETKDIDGNLVKSKDLFSAHAVTMINIWATWCGPCKKELKELGDIHRRLEAKNAAIVGICDDAKEKADECRALINKNDLPYINLLPYEEMDELAVESLPTTFFVDREGKIMTYPIVGVPADISDYEKTIDSLLAQEAPSFTPSPVNAAAEEKNACRVIVTDEEGSPVAGAAVQFCSDTTCMMGKTNAQGTASFAAEEGPYTVHVMKAPEGYEMCTEEFAVPQDLGDVTITLKKA